MWVSKETETHVKVQVTRKEVREFKRTRGLPGETVLGLWFLIDKRTGAVEDQPSNLLPVRGWHLRTLACRARDFALG